MKKLLSEKEIGANLLLVIEKKGDTQDSFGKRIKKDGKSVSNYVNISGGKKPSNLVKSLIELGINGNWYLTGEGEMFLMDAQGGAPESRRYEEAGRLLEAAVNALKA